MPRQRLRREDAALLIEGLMYEYSKPAFQTKLHAVYNGDCNPNAQLVINEELNSIRLKTIGRFGYPSTSRGWQRCTEEFRHFNVDPEIRRSLDELDILCFPHIQLALNKENEYDRQKSLDANWIDAHKSLEARRVKFRERYVKEEKSVGNSEFGRIWNVVGGKSNGGIVVRLGEDLQSAALLTRLAHGARVRELNMIGERLHFEKVSGEGPQYGWVSVMLKSSTLLRVQIIPKMPEGKQKLPRKLEIEIFESPEKKTGEEKWSFISPVSSEASTCFPGTPSLEFRPCLIGDESDWPITPEDDQEVWPAIPEKDTKEDLRIT